MKVRQEINLMCDTILTSTGTLSSSAIVQLDTTAYSGTPTFYFEVQLKGAASNTGTVKLRRFGTTTDDASITGSTSTTYALTRSASFSPPAGQTQYMVTLVGDSVRSQSVMVARIIVLQNETTISRTETQIEIGNQTAALINTVVADITNPKFWTYTAANWDGAKLFSAEVVWKTSSSNTATVTLCRTSDNAANVTITSFAASSAAYTRSRIAFIPVDGETYKIRCLGSTTKSSYTIACAKIIVDQYSADNVPVATPSGSQAVQGTGGTTERQGQSFTAVASYSCSTIRLQLFKSGTPTDNLTLDINNTSISAAAVNTSNTVAGSSILTTPGGPVDFTFTTPISISSGVKYYLRLFRSGARDIANYFNWSNRGDSFLANGGQYISNSGVWGSESASSDLEFEMEQTSVAITKLETQYLLLNTADSNATGIQNCLTTWNSTEWDAGSGTVTYKHAMDSDNASNSILLRNVTDSDDVTSTVTGSGQIVSSALTVGAGELVTAKNYDCWVLNTTGVIAASRILATYVFSSGPTVYTQSYTATFSPAALLNKRITDSGFVATLSFTGAFTKGLLYLRSFAATLSFVAVRGPTVIGKALTATFSPVAALTRAIAKSLTATLSFIGATTKKYLDAGFTATLSFVGNLSVSKTFLRALTATLSFSGILSRRGGKAFSATLSFVGVLTRRITRAFTATLSFVGVITRNVLKSFTATLSFIGNLATSFIAGGGHVFTQSLTATLSFTGALSNRAAKVFTATLSFVGAFIKRIPKSFSAALSFIGNLAVSKSFIRAFSATLSFVGAFSVSKSFLKVFTATLSFTGALSRSAGKAFSATLSFAASLVKRTARALSATLSFTGAIVKAIRDAGFTATLSFAGNLTTAAVHFFTRSFTATVSFVGAISTSRRFARALAATLNMSGVLRRNIGKSLSATLAFSTALRKAIRKGLSATLSFIGFVFRGGFVFVGAGQVTGSTLHIQVTGSTAAIGVAGSQLELKTRGVTQSILAISRAGSRLTVVRTDDQINVERTQ